MQESKIEITFKSSHISFPLYLRILKIAGKFQFSKIKSEKNRVIVYTNLKGNQKLQSLRNFFGFLNFYEILSIETTY